MLDIKIEHEPNYVHNFLEVALPVYMSLHAIIISDIINLKLHFYVHCILSKIINDYWYLT